MLTLINAIVRPKVYLLIITEIYAHETMAARDNSMKFKVFHQSLKYLVTPPTHYDRDLFCTIHSLIDKAFFPGIRHFINFISNFLYAALQHEKIRGCLVHCF